jgi:hypothetical protein
MPPLTHRATDLAVHAHLAWIAQAEILWMPSVHEATNSSRG